LLESSTLHWALLSHWSGAGALQNSQSPRATVGRSGDEMNVMTRSADVSAPSLIGCRDKEELSLSWEVYLGFRFKPPKPYRKKAAPALHHRAGADSPQASEWRSPLAHRGRGLRAGVKSNVLQSDSPRRGSRRCGRLYKAIRRLVERGLKGKRK